MLSLALLGLLLTASPDDWRSPDFKKAKAEVEVQLDKRGGNAVILEVKRSSPTELAVLSETRGEGAAWALVAIPKSDTSAKPKVIEIIDQNFEGMVLQTRPVRFKVTVPENESEMTFVMATKHREGNLWVNGSQLSWVKQLPVAKGETKIMVFYVPKSK